MADPIPYARLDAEALSNLETMHEQIVKTRFGSRAFAVAQSNTSRARKLFRLQSIAQELSDTVAPGCACRTGCSHCCNMSVSTSEEEARAIAQHLGLRYERPAPATDQQVSLDRVQYSGVPCPFLKAGQCEVYVVRPLACSSYFNLSNTSEICDLTQHPHHDVPGLDTRGFHLAQALALGQEFSDIRDWFPKGSAR